MSIKLLINALHVMSFEDEISVHLKIVPESEKHNLHIYMSLFLAIFLFNHDRVRLISKCIGFNITFPLSLFLPN